MARRSVKTRQELVRIEFGESRDHFRQAAHHAAGGIGASVGPKYTAAKVKASSARDMVGPSAAKVGSAAQQGWTSTKSALTPLAEAARQGSSRAAGLPSEKDTARSRKGADGAGGGTPIGLISLLAAGAALGAAGALVARRRNRARWAEYEPSELQPDASAMVGMGGDQPGAASKLASWAKESTKSAVESVRSKMPSGGKGMDGRNLDEINERVADAGADVTRDLSGETGEPGMASGGEGSGGKPGASSKKSGEPGTKTGQAPEGTASAADEVDALLRSSKNGKM